METKDNQYQEVYFHEYCKSCKHYEKDDMQKSPCDHCLDNPVNIQSHKPVDFAEEK